MYRIMIHRTDGIDHCAQEIPEDFNKDPEILVSELNHLCQLIYDMGRRDEKEQIARHFNEYQRNAL